MEVAWNSWIRRILCYHSGCAFDARTIFLLMCAIAVIAKASYARKSRQKSESRQARTPPSPERSPAGFEVGALEVEPCHGAGWNSFATNTTDHDLQNTRAPWFRFTAFYPPPTPPHHRDLSHTHARLSSPTHEVVRQMFVGMQT